MIGIAVFNLIATVLWFHFSQAKFTFNCTDMPGNNEQPDLCSTAGPYGIFISNLLLVPMSLIYCMVFYNRSEAAVMIIEEKIGKLDSNEDAVST